MLSIALRLYPEPAFVTTIFTTELLLGLERLVSWVNVAELPGLFPEDPGAVVLPLDLPTQAPAQPFNRLEKSVFGTVLAKNGSTGPDLAMLRDGRNGTASSIPGDNVWRQSDPVFDRLGIIL